MSMQNKIGNLAWAYGKFEQAAHWGEIAVNATDPSTREQAYFEAATSLAEAVGIGIPLWFADKALTKTGLDRVFDSLRKNKSFQEYLKYQSAQKNIRDFSLGHLAEWGLHELREWISINGYLDPLFDLMTGNYNSAKGWQPPRDPIILDLDGNGLQTVGLSSHIYFDHNGDGILSKTGWVGEGDALLVWDRNANGLIDNGAELFGDFTPMPDGSLAPNGFAALAALDANGDGILDASDPAFAELKLWVDSDQNGVTGEGELMSLADAGIASLNLGNTLKNQKQSNGNTLAREGSFTRTDGTESAMGEFHLAIDTFDTQFAEQIEVPESLRGLPMMNGSGNVRDLQQAATQSSSLQSLLGQFEDSTDRFEQQRNWSLCA